MTLHQLRCLVAVADDRNFTRAAQRLGLSQPALSRHVARLEAELGVQLVDRSRRQIVLTSAGASFVEGARSALRTLERAADAARAARDGVGARLVVGAGSVTSARVLPAVLAAFARAYPSLAVELRELSTAEQVAALLDGELDAGFVRLPLADRRLATRTVLREGYLVARPADHPLVPRRSPPRRGPEEPPEPSIALGRLRDEPMILTPRARMPGVYDQLVQACRDAGFEPRVAQHAAHLDTLLTLVATGRGVAIVMDSTRQRDRPGIVYVRLDAPGLSAALGVAWRRDDPSPALQAFLDTVGRVVTPRTGSARRASRG